MNIVLKSFLIMISIIVGATVSLYVLNKLADLFSKWFAISTEDAVNFVLITFGVIGFVWFIVFLCCDIERENFVERM